MSERLVIPPSIINNTVVALSRDRMCTVYWDVISKSFQSANGIYTVAEVADAPPASIKLIKNYDIKYVLDRKS